MEFVGAWLETLPAVAIYLIVGLVIGTESMGIPLPGEIVAGQCLAAGGHARIDI